MKKFETKQKFVELRAKGLSFDKIAKELGVTKMTLITWSKEFKTEISNMRAIELEKLQELYFITKERRIQTFGERLKKILDELEQRDLKDIQTTKLYDLALKYIELLKREEISLTFKENTIADLVDEWRV